MRLSLDQDRIVWPGGLSQKPTGLMIPTHLKVLTIVETPFVYARKLGKSTNNPIYISTADIQHKPYIEVPI